MNLFNQPCLWGIDIDAHAIRGALAIREQNRTKIKEHWDYPIACEQDIPVALKALAKQSHCKNIAIAISQSLARADHVVIDNELSELEILKHLEEMLEHNSHVDFVKHDQNETVTPRTKPPQNSGSSINPHSQQDETFIEDSKLNQSNINNSYIAMHCDKNILHDIHAAARSAKLKIRAIDINTHAIARHALCFDDLTLDDTVMAVDLKPNQIEMMILDGYSMPYRQSLDINPNTNHINQCIENYARANYSGMINGHAIDKIIINNPQAIRLDISELQNNKLIKNPLENLGIIENPFMLAEGMAMRIIYE